MRHIVSASNSSGVHSNDFLRNGGDPSHTYLIFVIFFTLAKFLENKIYTEKTRILRQNTQ